jgi:hypothetical protein
MSENHQNHNLVIEGDPGLESCQRWKIIVFDIIGREN